MIIHTPPRRGLAIFLAPMVALSVASACSVRTSGARSVEELQAEGEYASAYQRAVTPLLSDLQEYMPSADSPGVCNIGSSPGACLTMNRALLSDLASAKSILAQFGIPERHAEGNRLLIAGIDQLKEGLERMNDVLEERHGSLESSSAIMEQAMDTLSAAWNAFPEDAKPLPQL